MNHQAIFISSLEETSLLNHGHPDFWELVANPEGVYVECTKCGLPLVHLLIGDWKKRVAKMDHPDLDELAKPKKNKGVKNEAGRVHRKSR